MDTGSIITLILGTGFVTSLITLVGTYSLDKRQNDSERKFKIKDKIVAKVYSPLYLDILQLMENISSISGNLIGFLNATPETLEVSKQYLIDSLKQTNCPLFRSNSIREVLSSYIGFIKPIEFRRELSFYYTLMNGYENQILRLANEGLNDDIEADNKWIANMLDVSVQLTAVSAKFLLDFDKLMNSESTQAEVLFKTTLPQPTFKELISKIHSRNAILVKSYEEKTGTKI
jgi:hypothetical protein